MTNTFFRLRGDHPSAILDSYFDEIGCSKKDISTSAVRVVYRNALCDYLEKRIDAWVLENISLQLVFIQRQTVFKRLKRDAPKLADLVFKTTDIVWIEQSNQSAAFNEELRKSMSEFDKATPSRGSGQHK